MEIDASVIQKLLCTLDSHKSPRLDGLHPKILKVLGENPTFVSAVAILFRSCAITQSIPKAWKHAIIIALHKKGSFVDPTNFRPISLLCIMSKLYEKFLHQHILNHIAGHISQNQHGFTEGKSCLSNLLETLDVITMLMGEGQQANVIYLDFQKAFKLILYPMVGYLLNWNYWVSQVVC